MRLRDPSRRVGRPGTLTDVVRHEEDQVNEPQPSPLVQRRRRMTQEQFHEAMHLALVAEDNVRARREQIRDELAKSFYARRQTLPITLDLMVDKYAGEDGVVNYNIGQNQWQISRAQMFGAARVIEQNEKIIALLTEVRDELRRATDTA